MAETILNVLLVILIIAAVVLAALYFLGNKLQKRQMEQQQLLDAAAQTVSLLVIDKKKLKITQAGLPKMVVDQTPKYMRWTKIPVVKAKIGPKIMTLIADGQVFEALPVKTEVKVVLSGLYITQIKSVRGGTVPAAPKKKGFFPRLLNSNKQSCFSGSMFRKTAAGQMHLSAQQRFFIIRLNSPARTTAHPGVWSSLTNADD